MNVWPFIMSLWVAKAVRLKICCTKFCCIVLFIYSFLHCGSEPRLHILRSWVQIRSQQWIYLLKHYDCALLVRKVPFGSVVTVRHDDITVWGEPLLYLLLLTNITLKRLRYISQISKTISIFSAPLADTWGYLVIHIYYNYPCVFQMQKINYLTMSPYVWQTLANGFLGRLNASVVVLRL